MDNQHRKISGYRELSQAEIDLINRAKAMEKEFLALQEEVVKHIKDAVQATTGMLPLNAAQAEEKASEMERTRIAEPFRWAAIAKTDIQTGTMALVRAIAQPI